MRILVDMDDVIADFDKELLDRWKIKYPDKIQLKPEEITDFYIADMFPKELKPLVEDVYHAPGFIKSLPPMEGALEALLEMEKAVKEVFICTSPLTNYKNCVREKYEWVEQHLNSNWVKKIILTKDKTIVRGDILIDDKPEIRGVEIPSWEHIIYDRPYNRHITNKRRLTWQNWKEILKL
ncbi:5'-3'-deoxyribonucleotidase [Candidatus Woesearchaeota archaeon]|nr:5'-3'-deoxyribonucleotidase [Candidatus Woesearchaeota archaeon]